MEKVFISYSHEDEEWENLLRSHLGVLEQNQQIIVWDDRQIDGGQEWYPEIVKAMECADIAVCLISSDFLKSDFVNKEEIPFLLERRDSEGMLLLPVLVRPCLWKAVQWLSKIQMFPRDGKSISVDFENREDEAFLEVTEEIFNKINNPELKTTKIQTTWPVLADGCIDVERLPKTGEDIFGRANELQMLNDAWESEKINIISFVAWGGVGKSALVNKWVHRMTDDNYKGAEKVYAWSFYSQGTGRSVTSADMFINNAMHWFGDSEMAESNRSPWDKGKRLAELIQQQKTLLILDGLEPMQSDYEHDKGAIKDPALNVLIQQLAKSNEGLCVITTREQLTGIRKGKESIIQKDLEQISPEAGRALLRVNGIRGTDEELEQAASDFGCHALAINLLVAYLQDTDDRHIKNASSIPDLDISKEEGKHPRRVMQALADRFGSSPELNILHVIGLFDRPARAEEINWLRKQEEVPDLTDKIRWLTDNEMNRIITSLRHFRLIAPESHHNKGGFDAHPHVRTHFGQKLKEINAESWKIGHSHLYEFLKMSAPRLPDTLEEMEPLFAAVAHGCLAGRHQESFDDVYCRRISRGEKFYGTRMLGAFGADLAAVSSFFEKPWSKPKSSIKEQDKSIVLNLAGFRLRSLGRIREAVEPTVAGMEASIEQENWLCAAQDASNLSDICSTLGKVKEGVDYARKSVEFADLSTSYFQKMTKRVRLADLLHESGESSKAQELFKEAEEIQKKKQQNYPYLYSVQGFQFCDLLLCQGKYKEVKKRARQTLKWVTEQKWLLDIALDKLSLGRAYMVEAVSEGGARDEGRGRTGEGRGTSDEGGLREGPSTALPSTSSGQEAALRMKLEKAEDFLNQAVNGLRKAGRQDNIPRGLLARAELNRYKRDFEKALGDLELAREIAERGEMNLYIADYHLEAARVCLAEGGKEKEAREHYEEAKKRVEEMGYHRRDPEVLLIQAELEIVQGNKKEAKETLSKAKKRIDEMGCHRWDGEIERLGARGEG